MGNVFNAPESPLNGIKSGYLIEVTGDFIDEQKTKKRKRRRFVTLTNHYLIIQNEENEMDRIHLNEIINVTQNTQRETILKNTLDEIINDRGTIVLWIGMNSELIFICTSEKEATTWKLMIESMCIANQFAPFNKINYNINQQRPIFINHNSRYINCGKVIEYAETVIFSN
eukprot:400477_1